MVGSEGREVVRWEGYPSHLYMQSIMLIPCYTISFPSQVICYSDVLAKASFLTW